MRKFILTSCALAIIALVCYGCSQNKHSGSEDTKEQGEIEMLSDSIGSKNASDDYGVPDVVEAKDYEIVTTISQLL